MSKVAVLPVKLINVGEQGLAKLDGDLEGKTLVIAPDALKERCRFARNQIFIASGGFGCKPSALGSKVFGKDLDGEESYWRRSDFIGIASPELVARAKADKSQEKPVDPTDVCYMAIGPGYWAKGETIQEALKGLAKSLGKRSVKLGGKGISVYRAHRETYVNDWLSLSWPKGCPAPVEVK